MLEQRVSELVREREREREKKKKKKKKKKDKRIIFSTI